MGSTSPIMPEATLATTAPSKCSMKYPATQWQLCLGRSLIVSLKQWTGRVLGDKKLRNFTGP
jgi:hypothetical protein